MRRLIYCFLLLILASFLVACGSSADTVPTQVPIAEPGNETPSASPRPTDNPADLLPPTWTPQPTADSLTPAVGQSPNNDARLTAGQAIYIVQSGDTLGSIAELYDISIDDLARANSISDIDHIEVGQQLVIP